MQYHIFSLIISLFLGAAMASTAAAPQSVKDVFTPAQKLAVEKLVSAYIKDHPEELIASLQAGRDKEEEEKKADAQTFLDNNIQDILDLSMPYVTHQQKNTTVSTIFFIDYHCSFCHKIYKELSKVELKSNIAFIQLPILGPMSIRAAGVALSASSEQFKNVNKDLFSGIDLAKESVIADLVKKYKIKSQTDDILSEQLKKNYYLAQNLGIQGVPAVIVTNGKASKLFLGYVDVAQISDAVQALSVVTNSTPEVKVTAPQEQQEAPAPSPVDPKKVA